MKPQVGDLRTVTQRFDGEQWVLCLQSMPPRELSDEEIREVIKQMFDVGHFAPYNLEMFARAILKKAREK